MIALQSLYTMIFATLSSYTWKSLEWGTEKRKGLIIPSKIFRIYRCYQNQNQIIFQLCKKITQFTDSNQELNFLAKQTDPSIVNQIDASQQKKQLYLQNQGNMHAHDGNSENKNRFLPCSEP